LLRCESAVAAEQAIVLVGRIGVDVAELGRRYTRQLALSQGRAGTGTGARIDGARKAERRREEQLDDVRRANRAVVRGTEADVADRRELGRDLVRVDLEAVVDACSVNLIVGITV